MSWIGLGERQRDMMGLLRRRRKDRAVSGELDLAERSFRHIWRYVKFTNDARFEPKRSRPNVLVLQMGKVASLAIHQALNKAGINAFHAHSISLPSQERMLLHLSESEFAFRLASHELRYHVHTTALRMLVRWYETHQRYRGRKLQVITLTRDPVAFCRSIFIQRRVEVLPRIYDWQRARLGKPIDAAGDQFQAVQDFVTELASIMVDAGVENADACVALAHERWPQHSVLAQEVRVWLRPLSWLDREIKATFGLDVLASSELRDRGWVILENDWVKILALRFEQLSALLPRMAEFTGLSALTLPQRNVTSGKSGAAQYQAAVQASLESPVGQACVRALRASAYARACGYDAPST